MAKVAVYDMSGNTCGEMELSDAIFGVEINTHVMHEVVVAHLANRRQGTQSAKTRAEVRGGGKKPYRAEGNGTCPVRVASVLRSGLAVALYLPPSRAIILRRSTRRRVVWRCVPR